MVAVLFDLLKVLIVVRDGNVTFLMSSSHAWLLSLSLSLLLLLMLMDVLGAANFFDGILFYLKKYFF